LFILLWQPKVASANLLFPPSWHNILKVAAEIFELTGIKVGIDDPILVSALIQTKTVIRAVTSQSGPTQIIILSPTVAKAVGDNFLRKLTGNGLLNLESWLASMISLDTMKLLRLQILVVANQRAGAVGGSSDPTRKCRCETNKSRTKMCGARTLLLLSVVAHSRRFNVSSSRKRTSSEPMALATVFG